MFDLESYIERQKKWSLETFGGGERTLGILAHVEKELVECEQEPESLEEPIDVIILGLDGFWRHGGISSEARLDLYVYPIEGVLGKIKSGYDRPLFWLFVASYGAKLFRDRGGDLEKIGDHLLAKQEVNFTRKWPRPVSQDQPVEHIKEGDFA